MIARGPRRRPRRPGGLGAAQHSDPTLAAIAEQAWLGRHAQAIALATDALAAARLGPARRLALLDLRADSLVADGRFVDAAADAAQMRALAQARPRQAALTIRALNRAAQVWMRRGEPREALPLATSAVELARRQRARGLLGPSLLRLAEAELRSMQTAEAVASADEAARLFEAAGDAGGTGRALWLVAFAQSRRGNAQASRDAALRAAELARRTGDHEGLANALNVLAFGCRDIAERIGVLEQADAAYQRSGHVFGRGLVKGNLSLAFAELGLYRRACRIGAEVVALCERLGARLNLALQLGGNLTWRLALGDLAGVRAAWPDYEARVVGQEEPILRGTYVLTKSALALAEGDAAAAVKLLRASLRSGIATNSSHELPALVPLVRALLADGQPAAALRASRRATRIHLAQGLSRVDFGQSQDIWWWHARALAANGRADEAFEALQRAYGILLDAVRNVHDEGLRRSFLNKVEVNRAIVRAWMAEAARRRRPDAERLAHLAVEASLHEPMQRLVDTGVRLNEQPSEAALREFIVEEATEISGAERVLLVLVDDRGEFAIAGAQLPTGEDAPALLQAITPWLAEARLTRTVSLRHGPDGAPAVDQRSCLVAPLLAQHELLGFLYADLDGAFGRFNDADRDLLAMLASQAAVALANLRTSEGLERKVAQRTAEIERRADELALINGVQKAVAAQLSFDAVVEVIGARLRELFASEDIGIYRIDDTGTQVVTVYLVERGQRLHVAPFPYDTGGALETRLRTGEPLVLKDRAATEAWGIRTLPGTTPSRSSVFVPVKVGEQHRLTFRLVSLTREDAFDEATVRLLSTVAAATGTALENARLFSETQQALERQTATAEILRVISESPTDVQPVFDAITQRAMALCGASIGAFARFDGEWVHLDTFRGVSATAIGAIKAAFPMRPGPGSTTARAILEGRPVQNPDLLADPAYVLKDATRLAGYRANLAVPMLHDGKVIGALSICRETPGEFPQRQVELLCTFADQAVIAIQNTRLFNETQEALERQTATAEILRVISESPDDIQPVFHAIVGAAFRLLGDASVMLLMREGEHFRMRSIARPGEAVSGPGPSLVPLDATANFPSRVILGRQMLHIPDWLAVELPPHEQRVQAGEGLRSSLMLPIVQGDECIGVLGIARRTAGEFSAKEIGLLRAFVDQAVIAIHNVRLFNETRDALEKQTATADVLRAISSSPTSTLPVFEAIAERAMRLCAADFGFVFTCDTEWIRLGCARGVAPEGTRAIANHFPVRLRESNSVTARAIASGEVVNVADVLADPLYEMAAPARAANYRASLGVPMKRLDQDNG